MRRLAFDRLPEARIHSVPEFDGGKHQEMVPAVIAEQLQRGVAQQIPAPETADLE